MNASRLSPLLRQSLLQFSGRRLLLPSTMIRSVDVLRYKHSGAKMGQHLERLDELAHEQSQKKAQERRQKKKEKARKSDMPETAAAHAVEHEEDLYQEDEQESEQEEQLNLLPDPKETKLKMKSIVQRFVDSLKNMRGAEPTVALFDNVQVDAYGARTSLQSVAQVVLVSPTLATATCFDPTLAKAVRTALAQQLSLNPSAEEGGVVHIPLPRISLESRQKIAATLAKRAESYRQGIRQVRRKAMDIAKKGVAGKLEHVSKDDAFRVQQEIEAATEETILELNRAAEEKHNSIMVVE